MQIFLIFMWEIAPLVTNHSSIKLVFNTVVAQLVLNDENIQISIKSSRAHVSNFMKLDFSFQLGRCYEI